MVTFLIDSVASLLVKARGCLIIHVLGAKLDITHYEVTYTIVTKRVKVCRESLWEITMYTVTKWIGFKKKIMILACIVDSKKKIDLILGTIFEINEFLRNLAFSSCISYWVFVFYILRFSFKNLTHLLFLRLQLGAVDFEIEKDLGYGERGATWRVRPGGLVILLINFFQFFVFVYSIFLSICMRILWNEYNIIFMRVLLKDVTISNVIFIFSTFNLYYPLWFIACSTHSHWRVGV